MSQQEEEKEVKDLLERYSTMKKMFKTLRRRGLRLPFLRKRFSTNIRENLRVDL